jgi:hypothetical protein
MSLSGQASPLRRHDEVIIHSSPAGHAGKLGTIVELHRTSGGYSGARAIVQLHTTSHARVVIDTDCLEKVLDPLNEEDEYSRAREDAIESLVIQHAEAQEESTRAKEAQRKAEEATQRALRLLSQRKSPKIHKWEEVILGADEETLLSPSKLHAGRARTTRENKEYEEANNQAALVGFYQNHNPQRVAVADIILQQYSLEAIVGLCEQRYGEAPKFLLNGKKVAGVMQVEGIEQQRAIIDLEVASKELEAMAEEERLVWRLAAEEHAEAQTAIALEKEVAIAAIESEKEALMQQGAEYAQEMQRQLVEYEQRMQLMQEDTAAAVADTAAAVAAKEKAEEEVEQVRQQLELTQKWGGSMQAVDLELAYQKRMGTLGGSSISWKAAALREAAAEKRAEVQQAQAQQMDDQESMLLLEEKARLRAEKWQGKKGEKAGKKLVLLLHPLDQAPEGQDSMGLLRQDLSDAVGGEAKMQPSRVVVGRESISHITGVGTGGVGTVDRPEPVEMVLVEVTIAEPQSWTELQDSEIDFCGSASSVGSADEAEATAAAEAQALDGSPLAGTGTTTSSHSTSPTSHLPAGAVLGVDESWVLARAGQRFKGELSAEQVVAELMRQLAEHAVHRDAPLYWGGVSRQVDAAGSRLEVEKLRRREKEEQEREHWELVALLESEGADEEQMEALRARLATRGELVEMLASIVAKMEEQIQTCNRESLVQFDGEHTSLAAQTYTPPAAPRIRSADSPQLSRVSSPTSPPPPAGTSPLHKHIDQCAAQSAAYHARREAELHARLAAEREAARAKQEATRHAKALVVAWEELETSRTGIPSPNARLVLQQEQAEFHSNEDALHAFYQKYHPEAAGGVKGILEKYTPQEIVKKLTLRFGRGPRLMQDGEPVNPQVEHSLTAAMFNQAIVVD